MPSKGSKKGVWLAAGAALALNAVLWWLVWRFFPLGSPVAVLHYTVGGGIDFIGNGEQIKALPLVGLALLAVNLALGFMIVRASEAAAWIFWSSLPVIQVILGAAFIILWRFNT
jgi:hypothetical protein